MIVLPDPILAPAIMAAVKGSVGEQGLNPIQKSTMEAIAHDVMHTELDVAALSPLTPEQAAKEILDPQIRLQVVQAMLALELLLPLNDSEGKETEEAKLRVSRDQADLIESYAQAFDVSVGQLKTYRALADDNIKIMYFDLFARTALRRAAIDTIKDAGVRSFVKTMAAVRGVGTNQKVADKFRRLEDLPEGTWGRQVANMYQTNDWPYPGETHGAPEPTSMHDWVHVISGYSPTPVGELQVNTFMHTTMDDPSSFGQIVLAMSLYGLGNISLPIGNFTSDGGDLARNDIGHLFSEAVIRSKATGTDFMFEVDHWGNADKSVEAIREQYGIPEKTYDIGEGDPGIT